MINFDPKEIDPTNLTYEVMNNLNYHTFALNPFAPKWNDANPEARAYLINSAKYWTEEFGVDAWRMDVSIEISHDFWRELKQTLKEVSPHVYVIGENWDRSYPWLRDNQFDGMMNFEVTYNILEFIGDKYLHKKKTATEFIKDLHDYLVHYPKNMLPNMFNIADTQDTERVISFCENDVRKAKLVYALHMFMPGAPCIYYGSEVGLTGVTPYDGRKCMPWSPQPHTHELHSFLKQLIALRKENPAMANLEFEWLEIDTDHNAFILRKQTANNRVYLLLNNSDSEITFNNSSLSINDRTLSAYSFNIVVQSYDLD
ncbi:neopullulanase [Vibrio ishigakensis]|uniref:Neopullulanase n=1 Tax=Vibrio ishigakensis TaxID=1481914 RepID=A0A0B8NM44_9VIBR|nr:neopullulanase [Vibrio ishigakensis]